MSESEASAVDFIFNEDQRGKAAMSILLIEMMIESLKAKDGNMKDGKYLQSFHDGYLAGVALGAGAVTTYIEKARITETTGDILSDLKTELLQGMKMLKDEVGTYTA